MSEHRRPSAQMPAGASSLSERIAALQRKASDSARPASPAGMTRTPSSSISPSATAAPYSSSSSSSLQNQPQAVKDRIARFQQSASEFGERPLIPRSSFGAPAPNPENERVRVNRPYPGAAGGGTGNWGEGVLRPQMTGGAWLGTGTGSSGFASPRGPSGLMPQLTGPTWSRRQASTPGSLPSHPQRTIQGRDAFADLDIERSASPAGSDASGTPRSLGSHALDVATQAAAMKGLKLSPSMRRQSSTSTRSRSDQGEQRLPALPDAPTEDVDVAVARPNGSSSLVGGAGTAAAEQVQSLPTPPSEAPGQPRRTASSSHSTAAAADTSVEIEVLGASPSRMEAWRAQAAQHGGAPPDAAAAAPSAPASRSDEGEAFEMVTPALQDADLPARAGVSRTDSGRVDATDPRAHEVQGPALLVGRDEVTEKRRSQDVSLHAQTPSGSSGFGNGSIDSATGTSFTSHGAGVGEDAATISPSASHASSLSLSQQAAREVISAARTKSLGGMSPSPSTSFYKVTVTSPGSGSDFDTGKAPSQEPSESSQPAPAPSQQENPSSPPRAGPAPAQPLQPALAAQQHKPKPKPKTGGSIRRPPPGKMLSVADLDASDDEYEPGWASVISTSRN